MPRRLLSLLAAAAALAAAPACESYVEGNGVFYQEDRTDQVGSFAGLRVQDGIQGTVTVGPTPKVFVSGDSNLVKSISTVVATIDGVAVLDVFVALDSFTPTFPLSVTATTPGVQYLSASDASRIDAAGASTASGTAFRVVASDGSNVALSGAGGDLLNVALAGGSHGGPLLDSRNYPVPASGRTIVALAGSSRAWIHSDGRVTGTAEPGCAVENHGAGTCEVTDTVTRLVVANQCLPP